jgi:AraC-like DNA-binding protein
MQPIISWFTIINMLGITQALFFALLLLRIKKKGDQASLYLAAFLAAYALVQLGDVLDHSKYLLVFPHLNFLLPPLVFALGPLLFLCVQALTIKGFKPSLSHGLHFIPFVGLLLLLTPYFVLSGSEKIRLILLEYQHPDTDLTIPYLAILQVFLYVIGSLRLVLAHARAIKTYFSSIEQVSLKWLINLMAALLVIWVLWALNTKYPSLFFTYAEATLFTASVYILGFKGIYQPILFTKQNQPKLSPALPAAQENPPVKKYEKSSIAPDKIHQALLGLDQQMTTEKLYRQSQLTVAELAERVGLPSHHISQLLSEHLQTNFYDYVNRFRVEEVKESLVDAKKENITILALALEAGFNSKASFNNAFKKCTGVSPSQYKTQKLAENLQQMPGKQVLPY